MRLFRTSAALRSLCVALALAACAGPHASPPAPRGKPKLVLVVVFDQFRADYLTRFAPRFGEGGFRFFTEHAAYWPFARYGLLQAMTGPGHATILTGSYPYRNGISLNSWCSVDEKGRTRSLYCVQDERAPLVGGEGHISAPDPETECSGPSDSGVSPRRLLTSTVGDELKLAGYPARVVTVALKDRAAVLLGGHMADLALWFDAQRFHWMSSRYYLPGGALPEWVTRLNATIDARRDEPVVFKSDGPGTGLTFGQFEVRTRVGEKAALKTPLGVSLTVDAAIAAIDALGLGKGAATDVLAVSMSTHDAEGHDVGPNRREMEELTVAEDRELARLLREVGARLPHGLDDAIIALTADHGIPPSTPYVKGTGKDFAGYVDGVAIRDQAEAAMRARYGAPAGGSWVAGTIDLNYWLNPVSLQARKLDRDEAAAALRDEIARLTPDSDFVFTRADIAARRLPGGALAEHLLRGYRQGQGGDVISIPRAFHAAQGDVVAHMTDYSYDVSVPLAIAAAGMEPRVYAQGAEVIDLAPTLSFLLGIVAPALSEGRVLAEAVRAR